MIDASVRPITVSHAFGELVWLVSQSRLHASISVSDLAWLLLPPIIHRQFHIFRDGENPIGAVIWARTDEEGERKLQAGILMPSNHLTDRDWTSGDRLWLVDLITPFATLENRQREIMFADLVAGRLKGCAFKMQRIDPVTGQIDVVDVPARFGNDLANHLQQAGQEREDLQ